MSTSRLFTPYLREIPQTTRPANGEEKPEDAVYSGTPTNLPSQEG
ncbi:hypothetical protein ABHI18_000518 [Aspergillus niger]